MLKKDVEKELFKHFASSGCSDVNLFNSIIRLFDREIKREIGYIDYEFYDYLTSLINVENNTGWDTNTSHLKKLEIMREIGNTIEERSGDYLP